MECSLNVPDGKLQEQDRRRRRVRFFDWHHYAAGHPSINILYQREIYPPETFRRVAKYGLAMFVTTDEGLGGYLSQVLTQLHGMRQQRMCNSTAADLASSSPASFAVCVLTPECPISIPAEWLETGAVQKLVLVITSQETGETLERWVFDLQTDKSITEHDRVDKSEKEVQAEIAAIQRQITASVTFLPLNDEPCAFDLLVYTDDNLQVPTKWETSDPKLIVNADEVKLRSFTTKVHKVDASVSYVARAYPSQTLCSIRGGNAALAPMQPLSPSPLSRAVVVICFTSRRYKADA